MMCVRQNKPHHSRQGAQSATRRWRLYNCSYRSRDARVWMCVRVFIAPANGQKETHKGGVLTNEATLQRGLIQHSAPHRWCDGDTRRANRSTQSL